MSFWDKHLGGPTPPPAEPRPVQAWWNNAPSSLPPVAPPMHLESVPEESTRGQRIVAAQDERGRCPNCGSGAFGRASANTVQRCYECNFMPGRDFAHSTAGMIVPSGAPNKGGVRQAKGAGYNPGVIIGHT